MSGYKSIGSKESADKTSKTASANSTNTAESSQEDTPKGDTPESKVQPGIGVNNPERRRPDGRKRW